MGDIFEHNIRYQDGSTIQIFFKILSKKSTPFTRTELLDYLYNNHNTLATGLSCSGYAEGYTWCVVSNTVGRLTVYRGSGFTTNSTSGNVSDTIKKIY